MRIMTSKPTCFPFEINGCDIVIGVEWLRTLGPITIEFQELYMRFKKNGNTHTMRGLQVGSPTIINSHRMENILRKGHNGIVALFNAIHEIKSNPLQIHCDMRQVLDCHQQALKKPKDLPSSRGEHDHRIHFLLFTQRSNVYPYRYHFTQKNKIKKIIKELIDVDVIHLSTNPYSSPVVMVQKKDS